MALETEVALRRVSWLAIFELSQTYSARLRSLLLVKSGSSHSSPGLQVAAERIRQGRKEVFVEKETGRSFEEKKRWIRDLKEYGNWRSIRWRKIQLQRRIWAPDLRRYSNPYHSMTYYNYLCNLLNEVEIFLSDFIFRSWNGWKKWWTRLARTKQAM